MEFGFSVVAFWNWHAVVLYEHTVLIPLVVYIGVDVLGISWVHLGSLGFPLVHIDSLGFAWAYFGLEFWEISIMSL